MELENKRANRKVKKGIVVSNKMQKTVVVRIQDRIRHPRYGKVVNRKKKIYAHHEQPIEIGSVVTVMETRPLSKLKRWRVIA